MTQRHDTKSIKLRQTYNLYNSIEFKKGNGCLIVLIHNTYLILKAYNFLNI